MSIEAARTCDGIGGNTRGGNVSESGPQAAARYLALDALRGAAAVAVLFYHLRNLEATGRPAWAGGMFASGYLAVDLFFVLSGFVIAHAYDDRLRHSMTTRQFMLARFIRLQPVIAIGTLIGCAFALVQRLIGLSGAPGLWAIATSLPLNLMMLPNVLLPWGIFLFNPPAWSLFYELLANGLYAMSLRAKPRRSSGIQNLCGPIVFCIAGSAGLAICVLAVGNLDRGVDLPDWPVAIARIAFSFTLGLLLHRTRGTWMARTPRIPVPWLLAACVLLLIPDLSGAVRQFYDLSFAMLLSPLLVMQGAVTQPGPRSHTVTTWLGLISYPLYAIHAPIKHFAETFLPLSFAPLLILTAMMALAAAWFVAIAIDPPIRRWLSAFAGPRMKVLSPATASSSPIAGGR